MFYNIRKVELFLKLVTSLLSVRNALFNLINNQQDIEKTYLYEKDPYEAKYQCLINKREKVGLNHYDDPKAFMEYSNDMQDIYKNIEDYNPDKKEKYR